MSHIATRCQVGLQAAGITAHHHTLHTPSPCHQSSGHHHHHIGAAVQFCSRGSAWGFSHGCSIHHLSHCHIFRVIVAIVIASTSFIVPGSHAALINPSRGQVSFRQVQPQTAKWQVWAHWQHWQAIQFHNPGSFKPFIQASFPQGATTPQLFFQRQPNLSPFPRGVGDPFQTILGNGHLGGLGPPFFPPKR